MKIRNGFVSNSSTSSFIVGLPKNEHYYHSRDIHNLLFPDRKYDESISCSEWTIPLYCVTYVIAKELKNKIPITTKRDFFKTIYDRGGNILSISYDYDSPSNKLFEEFRKKYGEEHDNNVYESKEYQEYIKAQQMEWKEANRRMLQKAKELAEEHWPTFKKLNNFVIEYGDEEGILGMIMEANPIFKNVPNIDLLTH